jgi:hypothetical protein
VAWVCASCSYHNADAALTCEACGIAQRWHDDPPLDLPRAPGWFEVGATWALAAYGALAAGGTLLLLTPQWLERLGIGAHWVFLEVVLTGAAALHALVEAVWQRSFNQAGVRVLSSLSASEAVRTGEPFEAVLTLIPYRTLPRVWVRIELVDRYYEHVRRQGRRQTQLRSRVLDAFVLQSGEPLHGRREHAFHARFLAPVPSAAQHDVMSELVASALGVLGPIVPGVSHYAHNLREHGGFFVRAVVRVGIWRRVFERRVIAVVVPSALQATPASASPSGRQP